MDLVRATSFVEGMVTGRACDLSSRDDLTLLDASAAIANQPIVRLTYRQHADLFRQDQELVRWEMPRNITATHAFDAFVVHSE